MLDKIRSRYGQSKGTKDFVLLLMLYRSYTSSEIETAVELALEAGVADSAGVKHILLFTSDKSKKKNHYLIGKLYLLLTHQSMTNLVVLKEYFNQGDVAE